MKSRRSISRPLALIALALLGATTTGWTQGWSPQRNVEIVVGFPAGGNQDKTARTLKQLLEANKLLNSSITVANKAGGGASIAYTYLSQRPPDGQTLMIVGLTLFTNHIMGSSSLSYTDFTPIASLFNEYVAFSVNAASPVRSGSDLTERLKKDPKSLTLGGTFGGSTHIAPGLLMKALGGNPRDLKVVSFKGAPEAVTNLLGSHVDFVAVPASVAFPHVAAGRLRVVAVSAPARFGGAFAGVPTWRELGVDVVFSLPRWIIGPKGITASQTVYWENALRKVTETVEWKTDLEKNLWSDDFVTGAQFRKDLAKDYAAMKAVLVDLGLAKQ